MSNEELEKEIIKIKERNKRVELDKKWETSWTRKICICILTYIVVIIYSNMINKFTNVALSSLVPVICSFKFISSCYRFRIIYIIFKISKKCLGEEGK